MTITLTKAVEVQLKAAAGDSGNDLELGEFTALVSAFGNVDSYGDVVMPGAFAKSLAEAETTGDPIPVIWNHDWSDPFSHIGEVIKAEETTDGLLVTARVDMDTSRGAQVFRLLKGRRVRQFSFAFDIRPGGAGWATRKDDATGAEYEVFELRDLVLHEVGPCLVGVNRETQLESVKAARAEYTDHPTRDRKAAEEGKGSSDEDGQEQEPTSHDGDGAADDEDEAGDAESGARETPSSASAADGAASVDYWTAQMTALERRS